MFLNNGFLRLFVLVSCFGLFVFFDMLICHRASDGEGSYPQTLSKFVTSLTFLSTTLSRIGRLLCPVPTHPLDAMTCHHVPPLACWILFLPVSSLRHRFKFVAYYAPAQSHLSSPTPKQSKYNANTFVQPRRHARVASPSPSLPLSRDSPTFPSPCPSRSQVVSFRFPPRLLKALVSVSSPSVISSSFGVS